METTVHFIQWAYNKHDVECNQKYDKVMPYSQHLKYVQAQADLFVAVSKKD